jgi:transposase-like protein
MSDGLLRCAACDRRTSATAGTIFADTRLPLVTWSAAAWYATGTKHGVSALSLERVLGLGSYETAWALLHKLRRGMVRPGRDRLAGEVEVDETYVGGVAPGKHGRGAEKKTPVLIAVEKRGRGMGRVRFAPIVDTSADGLLPVIEQLIELGSVVSTDGHAGYNALAELGYLHDRHSLYATGDPAHVAMPRVHRVASLLKRWLLGTHQGAVRPHQLDDYLDEFTFRFQPPRLQPPRSALPPAARAGRSDRPHPANRDRRQPPLITAHRTKGRDRDSPLSQSRSPCSFSRSGVRLTTATCCTALPGSGRPISPTPSHSCSSGRCGRIDPPWVRWRLSYVVATIPVLSVL